MPNENEARLIMQARDTAATLLETGTPMAAVEAMADEHDTTEARAIERERECSEAGEMIDMFVHAIDRMRSRAIAIGIRQAIDEHAGK